jgi:hypothetical protein
MSVCMTEPHATLLSVGDTVINQRTAHFVRNAVAYRAA